MLDGQSLRLCGHWSVEVRERMCYMFRVLFTGIKKTSVCSNSLGER